jgi:protein-S-isoprenylcysteine O-methyltransferase Ste14
MRRTTAILGSAFFFVIAPCVAAVLVPWWITRWHVLPAFWGWQPGRIIGAVLVLAGIPVLVDSFARFAIQGLGTPAPIAPPTKLVVTGLYRHVRNPMYVSVIAIVFGQALLFGDWRLIVYGAVFWFACHLYVILYEEPTLARSFGEAYKVFCANVPRWIPRLAPWRGA